MGDLTPASRSPPRSRPVALRIICPSTQFEVCLEERNHMSEHVEQLEFKAEARQLLDLMVHSIYS
ncbi:MAG: hypothetical protein KDB44_12660, partial [Mycobacterium sp.]|nr:hypothetical protein [Mycobacterium sp.]